MSGGPLQQEEHRGDGAYGVVALVPTPEPSRLAPNEGREPLAGPRLSRLVDSSTANVKPP